MSYILTKIDDLPNDKAWFRLEVTQENFTVMFNRSNFRSILEGLGWSSQRIGYVVKLLNKLYPLDIKPVVFSESNCSTKDLIDFVVSRGYRVIKSLPLDLHKAVFELQKRGYEVYPSLSLDGVLNLGGVYNEISN